MNMVTSTEDEKAACCDTLEQAAMDVSQEIIDGMIKDGCIVPPEICDEIYWHVYSSMLLGVEAYVQ
jgi:hypothetical protein